MLRLLALVSLAAAVLGFTPPGGPRATPPSMKSAAPARAAQEADTCELVKLDAAASTVIGRHYRTEAWICKDAEGSNKFMDSGCEPVMHEGELRWACDTTLTDWEAVGWDM